jgi:L-ascorbate metabolism protein UlaG (beta-lactamase superfamily)
MRMLSCSVFATTLTAAALVANQAGTVPAAEGSIQITPIMRASVQIEYAGKIIQVDPMGKNDYTQAKPADLILVTDIDPDNLDPDQIARIRKPGAPVVMPAAAAKLAGARIPAPITVTANGETQTVAGVSIEAVPMYNAQRGPKSGEFYHPKGRGNGYIVTLGGTRLYFAGDTECTPEMKALKNIDVAFVPMLMPSTMTPFEAAECVKAFQPKVVYAYHYEGLKQDEAFFRAALKGTQVDVRVQTQK